jgi:hypothetical protein
MEECLLNSKSDGFFSKLVTDERNIHKLLAIIPQLACWID